MGFTAEDYISSKCIIAYKMHKAEVVNFNYFIRLNGMMAMCDKLINPFFLHSKLCFFMFQFWKLQDNYFSFGTILDNIKYNQPGC